MTNGKTQFSVKKKLFIIADAGVDTGFAQVTDNLVQNIYTGWDIHILAINYHGDPHPLQEKAKLYNPSARVQSDYYGFNRVRELVGKVNPDVILLINDPWVAATYTSLLQGHRSAKVLYTPVDGANLNVDFVKPLNGVFDHVVAYTKYGQQQLELAGLETPISVIPHGVNKKLWKPVDIAEARQKNDFPTDWFIVNVTDRNQLRKRIDLAFHYFAEWVHLTNKPDSVKIHYHGAIEDDGWNILQLADGMGIRDRLIITAPNITAAEGLPQHLMPYTYGTANVGLSTTMGEGWGMTTHERMAMGIPMIVPEYSALAEWPRGGVFYTTISDIPFYNPKNLNTKAGIAERQSVIDALESLYANEPYRLDLGARGMKIATSDKFNWHFIGKQFNGIFQLAMRDRKIALAKAEEQSKETKEDG